MRTWLTALLCLLPLPSVAESAGWRLEHRVQLWLMTTFDAAIDPSENGALKHVRPEGDLFIRRGRIRLVATLPHTFDMLIQAQYDGLQQNAGTLGAVEGQVGPALKIRDAYARWKGESIETQAGYFHPATTREGERSPFEIPSFEKSELQTYVRRHTSGENSGRMAGIQATMHTDGPWQLGGTLGVFDPISPNLVGEGFEVNPLFVARLRLENQQDDSSVRLSLSGSWQGPSEVFRQNATAGADVDVTIGRFLIQGEGHALFRETSSRTVDFVWMARIGWKIPVKERAFLPAVTWTGYRAQTDGRQDSIEGAVLFLISPKLQVGAAFHWQTGQATSLFTDGRSFRQGPWLAVGVQHEL